MDSCIVHKNASHLQLDDLRGDLLVEQSYRNLDIDRVISVVYTRGVVGHVSACRTREPIHPPLVLHGNLRLCWEPCGSLAPSPAEKVDEPTDRRVQYRRDRQRLSTVDSFVLRFPESRCPFVWS